MGDTGTTPGIGCTKSKLFPYSIFGACDNYYRITSSTTQLLCQTCADGKAIPYCKQNIDNCDISPPGPGVEVNVNGVPTCALYGFVNLCKDYNSIISSTRTLTTCKICNGTNSPVTSVTDASICIPTAKVVTNCSKYEPLT